MSATAGGVPLRAYVLAGGLGTRLASVVADRAKPVAEVGGRPFVHYVLEQLDASAELAEVVLCVGHMAGSVRAALGDRFGHLALRYSDEAQPMGTGGAVALALRRLAPGEALVLNGDSYVELELDAMIAAHRRERAFATVALVQVADRGRYGGVAVEDGRVVGFGEKQGAGAGAVNAGIYCLSASACDELAAREGPFSLERDVLPGWCAARDVRAYARTGRFIDIGTPDDYARSAAVVGARPC